MRQKFFEVINFRCLRLCQTSIRILRYGVRICGGLSLPTLPNFIPRHLNLDVERGRKLKSHKNLSKNLKRPCLPDILLRARGMKLFALRRRLTEVRATSLAFR
jgi:hypothetical protein